MKYFTLDELLRSATARRLALDNTPGTRHRANLEALVRELLDPLRAAWEARCRTCGLGSPALDVTSGYRGFRLNEAVGGAAASAHCCGFAADLVPANGRLPEFKGFCREFVRTRAFDQLISEGEDAAGVPRWMHLGYKSPRGGQRRELLTMRGGKYIPMTA